MAWLVCVHFRFDSTLQTSFVVLLTLYFFDGYQTAIDRIDRVDWYRLLEESTTGQAKKAMGDYEINPIELGTHRRIRMLP